jgi:hypothetical protein
MPAPTDYKTARAMLAEYEERTRYKVLYFNPRSACATRTRTVS